MYADPFESVKIPCLEAIVQPFANLLGYKYLAKHSSEVILAAIFYQTVFILSGFISPYFVSSYRTLPAKTRVNFDIHVASHVQAVLILVACIPLFGDPILAKDHFTAYTPYSGFVCAIALGYFLWDVFICIKYYSMFGMGFLVHGLAAFFVFVQSMRPMLLYYCPHFLFFELSTPFLNVNWFASHLPEGTISFTVQKINGLFLLASFFFVRIVWGFYQTFNVGCDFLASSGVDRPYPLWVAVGILLSNTSLNFLNVYWFYKMLRLAKRAISSGSGQSNKKK